MAWSSPRLEPGGAAGLGAGVARRPAAGARGIDRLDAGRRFQPVAWYVFRTSAGLYLASGPSARSALVFFPNRSPRVRRSRPGQPRPGADRQARPVDSRSIYPRRRGPAGREGRGDPRCSTLAEVELITTIVAEPVFRAGGSCAVHVAGTRSLGSRAWFSDISWRRQRRDHLDVGQEHGQDDEQDDPAQDQDEQGLDQVAQVLDHASRPAPRSRRPGGSGSRGSCPSPRPRRAPR